jgi:hypothetical protein
MRGARKHSNLIQGAFLNLGNTFCRSSFVAAGFTLTGGVDLIDVKAFHFSCTTKPCP